MSSTILSPTALQVRHVASNPSITLLTPSPSTRMSNPSLTPTRRASPQPLHVLPGRLPSSRPSSIPSSPTSIRSSSSAIFERDIEQISLSSSTSPSRPDPHHVSRAITHEAVDASVPSVLDQAVSVLAQSDGTSRSPQEDISVITPAPAAVSGLGSSVHSGHNLYASTSGFASPAFIASRSPSPTGTQTSVTNVNAATGSPKMGSRPLLNERRTDSSLPAAPGAFPSPSARHAPLASASPNHGPVALPSSGPIPRPQKTNSLPAPDDPFQSGGNKRLSFVSYHDLLLSTPVAATSLSALTSPNTNEPPPHLPHISQPHPAISLGGVSPVGSTYRDSVWGKEEGGEWEREGFGRGLDERLDELLHSDAASAIAKAS